MLLTAHGGALGTGRNTPTFFEKIVNYKADVIEVDIYKRGNLLYISHLPKIFVRKALTLEFVFNYIKENNFMVNCDVKTKGLVKPVLQLAKDMKVADKIIFTGSICKDDLKYLDAGQAFLNIGFFFPLLPKTNSLEAIKAIISNLNNDNIAGINLHYRFCNEEMLEKAKQIGLKLSVFTVDNVEVLERLIQHKELANITTNKIDIAINLRYN